MFIYMKICPTTKSTAEPAEAITLRLPRSLAHRVRGLKNPHDFITQLLHQALETRSDPRQEEKMIRYGTQDMSPARALMHCSCTHPCDHEAHELDRSHLSVAAPEPRAAATDSSPPSAAQGSPQHGVRRRAGEPANAGSRARSHHAEKRCLDTAPGVLSHSKFAPAFADRWCTSNVTTPSPRHRQCSSGERRNRGGHDVF